MAWDSRPRRERSQSRQGTAKHPRSSKEGKTGPEGENPGPRVYHTTEGKKEPRPTDNGPGRGRSVETRTIIVLQPDGSTKRYRETVMQTRVEDTGEEDDLWPMTTKIGTGPTTGCSWRLKMPWTVNSGMPTSLMAVRGIMPGQAANVTGPLLNTGDTPQEQARSPVGRTSQDAPQ